MNLVSVPFHDRHEDLKMMLDSNKEGQKREAMKIIMGVSDCIAVVVCVLCKLNMVLACVSTCNTIHVIFM